MEIASEYDVLQYPDILPQYYKYLYPRRKNSNVHEQPNGIRFIKRSSYIIPHDVLFFDNYPNEEPIMWIVRLNPPYNWLGYVDETLTIHRTKEGRYA